ncbi:MAG: hypothetical protein J5800_02340 [Spirochaetales bacterium]|nr:hypothetical protein [Spirochaetales bacterium]MBR4426820.1 hypothetical protein [Spirochaetales bacterium]
MMKGKIAKLLVVLVIVLIAFTSCSTTIALKTLVPAKVDVSGYKTIAVMSTQDNTKWIRPSFWNSVVPIKSVDQKFYRDVSIVSGLDFNVSSAVTDAATDMIYKAIDTGISYKVIEPKLTDAYVTVGQSNMNLRKTLMDNKVDAILKTEISYLYYDEYIKQETEIFSSKDQYGNTYYQKNFYFVQQYGLTISYTLTDVENNRIIATGSFSSDNRENSTRIGHTVDSTDRYVHDYYTITSASRLFRNLITEFTDSFRSELSPHYVTEYFQFFKNKPKVDSLEDAYEALEDERWKVAQDLFYAEYKKSGHINAGLNASILFFANGDYDMAFSLSQEIYNKTGDPDALDLYYHFKKIADRENAAEEQINGTEKIGANGDSSDLIGF